MSALVVVSLLEQIYRNLMPDSRSSVKYVCVALFVIAAYDIFFYLRAISNGALEMDPWAARGFVNTLVVPILGVAGWRAVVDRIVDIR